MSPKHQITDRNPRKSYHSLLVRHTTTRLIISGGQTVLGRHILVSCVHTFCTLFLTEQPATKTIDFKQMFCGLQVFVSRALYFRHGVRKYPPAGLLVVFMPRWWIYTKYCYEKMLLIVPAERGHNLNELKIPCVCQNRRFEVSLKWHNSRCQIVIGLAPCHQPPSSWTSFLINFLPHQLLPSSTNLQPFQMYYRNFGDIDNALANEEINLRICTNEWCSHCNWTNAFLFLLQTKFW